MKPTLPQGTRDFNAATLYKRNYIFKTIREIFELYGFQPLETPAFENIDTLTGKYGEEGDQLLFKILNNGLSRPEKRTQALEDFQKLLEGKTVKGITEKALRYDLTIPFSRYVAMNHAQLHFPFKRYQIQPVWRADRPQRGRYREFYQCDADIVGSQSLWCEVELACLYHHVFQKLGIGCVIQLNSRHVLMALAEQCGGTQNFVALTRAIDKLDKTALTEVLTELKTQNFSEAALQLLQQYLSIKGTAEHKLQQLQLLLPNSRQLQQAVQEFQFIFNHVPNHVKEYLEINFSLARGLNYYTGIIFEVKATNVQMGSIGGGGRYDNLTGLFNVPNMPGIGISFGVERIFDVMEELQLFPHEEPLTSRVLFFNLGEKESTAAYSLIQQLRQNGVACELYDEPVKFEKQFKYAEKKNIPYVIILGSEELSNKSVTIKHLKSGQQQTISQQQLMHFSFS
jgi:histidyl-tRNA synthetase